MVLGKPEGGARPNDRIPEGQERAGIATMTVAHRAVMLRVMIAGRQLAVLIASVLALAAPHGAAGQDQFGRPLRLVVGFTAGGTTDFVARLLAERLRGSLGQPVVVENRPGANGAIAVTIGVTGLGAISHLGLELFQSAAGVKFQAVPYRGASQAVTDLLGGQLDGLFGDVPTVIAQIKAGKLKALAATSRERSDIFPDVPTFVEQGFPDTVANQWAGTLAPALTPPATIAKLNSAFNAALTDPDVRGMLAQTGVTPAPGTPDEFARYLQEEIARWGQLIRAKGIRGE
jgi:tripartite-type tricarboxylate transporter receptor subunit TctC